MTLPSPSLLTRSERHLLEQVRQSRAVPDTQTAQQTLSYLHERGLLSSAQCDRASKLQRRRDGSRQRDRHHTHAASQHPQAGKPQKKKRDAGVPMCAESEPKELTGLQHGLPRLGIFIPGDAITAEHFRHLQAGAQWTTRPIEGESELLELVYDPPKPALSVQLRVQSPA